MTTLADLTRPLLATAAVARLVEWRTIPSFPQYEASEDGQIRRGNRVLKPRGRADGYKQMTLWVEGRPFHPRVHQLVCEAFHGKRPPGMECRHLDGASENNRAINLIWGTKAQNEADKVLHGTVQRGAKCWQHGV